jgi:hypothetical protein
MSRREPLDLPEDDDRPRRRRPKSSGVPVWAWVVGGMAAFGLIGCVGLGALFFAGAGAVRDAAQRVQDEEKLKQSQTKWEGPPIDSLALYNAYKDDPAGAAAKYGTGTIRVRLLVTDVGAVGDTAILKHKFNPPGIYPHVEAWVQSADVRHVTSGKTVVVEGKIDSRGDYHIMIRGHVVP